MADLSRIAPLPDPAARTNAQPTGSVVSKAVRWGHAAITAGALGTTGYLATQQTPAPTPTEQTKSAPTAEAPKKADPTPYEVALRAAWEIESGHDLHRKRLLYLYRGALVKVKAAKTLAELQTAFATEEKRLDMKGRLPLLRAVIREKWEKDGYATYVTLTDQQRTNLVAFFTQSIGILERLP